jgi:hypothetical protein
VVAFEHGSVITVRNLVASTTTAGPAGLFPDLSGDGRVLVFQSGVSIMRSDPANAPPTLVAVTGASGNVSADGTRVTFETTDQLVGGDLNTKLDVYAWRPTGPVEWVSQDGSGSGVNRDSNRPAISADGGTVAFGLNDGAAPLPRQSLNADDRDGALDVLAKSLTPTDVTGPALTALSPADATSVTTATIGVSGAASDPSGVVSVTVNGFPALLGPTNSFGVEVPLAVGQRVLSVRAVDGAGRVSEHLIAVTRTGVHSPLAARKARARSLRIYRAGRTTRVRFVLDAGARGVTVRLWKRVVHPLRAPTWTPVNSLRKVVATRGRRTALVSPRPLRAGIYQVRVTVISPGGVAVGVIRYVVARGT